MPKSTSAKRKPRRATASAQFVPASPKLAIVPAAAAEKRVRGVKLKTVSTLTMAFRAAMLGRVHGRASLGVSGRANGDYSGTQGARDVARIKDRNVPGEGS